MDSFIQEKFHYWKNVHGFNFSSVIPLMKEKSIQQQPLITIVKPEQLLSQPIVIKDIDLHTVVSEELRFVQYPFEFQATKSGSLHGFCCWFEVIFEGNTEDETVILSTSPDKEETHWKQTVFMLPDELKVEPGSTVSGIITLATDTTNPRHYNVSIEIPEEKEASNHPIDCDCMKCQIMKALGLQIE